MTHTSTKQSLPVTGNRGAARATGRCYGAMFFALFGGAWWWLAAYAAGLLRTTTHGSKIAVVVYGAIAAVVVLLLVTAVQVQKRGSQAAIDAYPAEQVRRNGRAFGILNAVQWVAIILVTQILVRTGRTNLAIDAVVLIVGLHFFAMPPLYRSRANTMTGVWLTTLGIVCPLLFHVSGYGESDAMVTVSAAGAGIVLWSSAFIGLRAARRLLTDNGL